MRVINPTERKLKVLEAVVNSYIQNGEPIGSKAVCNMLDFPVSSATIRNDFAELTELGYIIQPHTSAGRIPSVDGIRLYIDKIMVQSEISRTQAEYIKDDLSDNGEEPGNILNRAVKLLSEITGFLSFGIPPDTELARVHSIKVLKISRHSSMVILITNTGIVKTKLYRCDFVITPEIMAVFEKILNDRLAGVPISEITLSYMQTMTSSLGQLALLMLNLIWAVLDLATEIQKNTVFVYGKTNLLNFSEYSTEAVKNIVNFVDNKDSVSILYDKFDDEKVFLGNESNLDFLYDSSVIVKKYKLKSGAKGIIGVIGTNRVNYSKVIPLVGFVSDTVSEMIDNLTEEK